MNHEEFALFITWTCYGTWLPGDARGYVANTRSARGGYRPLRNIPGTRFDADDQDSRNLARRAQRFAAARLGPSDAKIVAESLIATATERQWMILRGAVMANHVHLVVRNCPDDGSAVRRVFKGVSQAALNANREIKRRWWTQGGSDRYLHGNEHILAAMRYVSQQEFRLVQIEMNSVSDSNSERS